MQNAEPNSMVVMWEYSKFDSSFLEWGESTDLGNTVSVTYEFTNYPACVYTANIFEFLEADKNIFIE